MFDTEKRRNILGGHRILLFGILCLFGICAAQVRPTNGKQKKAISEMSKTLTEDCYQKKGSFAEKLKEMFK